MAVFRYQSGDRPLDGYTIQYAIGRGGFGEVYYAESDAGRQVALKEIQNYEDIELRGISHCMNLKSQHLVSIFDVRNAADGTPWVIMEFVSGPSLRQILDESPGGIGAEKAAFFIRELAKGLAYLHGAGVVHRDLKPHNVFFEDGIVKIGDYSLSKVITTSHRSGHTMTVGSVHYMAPEISMGSYDKTVDIYALGIMLHEMLTGQPPYTGESMGEVLMKHLSAEPDVSGISQPYASAIKKAMARDPSERFQSAEEMASAIYGAEPISDMTGAFGPASLSIVSDQAARHARPQESTSTDRIRDALSPTIPGRPVDNSHPPMYSLGRGLRRLAIASAMLPGDGRTDLPNRTDEIPGYARFLLAGGTMAVMAIGAECISRVFISYHYWQPNMDTPAMWTILDAFLASAILLIGTLLTRELIDRRIFTSDGLVSRAVHLVVCGALFMILYYGRSFAQYWIYGGLFVSVAESLVIGIGISLIVQNWALLVSPKRRVRIRLWPVLFGGLLAMVAGSFAGLPITAMVIVSSAALAVQVAARFDSAASRPSLPEGIANSDVTDDLHQAIQEDSAQLKVSL